MNHLKPIANVLTFLSLMTPRFAISQSKLSNTDPCFKDAKSTPCQHKIQRSIFLAIEQGGLNYVKFVDILLKSTIPIIMMHLKGLRNHFVK